MNKHAIKKLEFDIIFDDILSYLNDFSVEEKFRNLGFIRYKQELIERQNIIKEAIEVATYHAPVLTTKCDGLDELVSNAKLGSKLEIEDIILIYDNLRAQKRMLEYFRKLENIEDRFPLLNNYISIINPVEIIISKCDKTFDNYSNIKDDATENLLSIRNKIKSLNNKIRQRLDSLLSDEKVLPYLQEKIITIRSNRYVIPVKSAYKSDVEGLVHDKSSTGSTLYIEPIELVKSNNELSELLIQEKQEIDRILMLLSSDVAKYSFEILNNQEALINLNLYIKLGKYHLENELYHAKISNKIELVNAKHPFIDKNKVVPLNLEMGDKQRVLIISGPNTGGKTVVLKTVGLFSLMHHYGLGIYASSTSSLKLFDEIYVDIGDEQNIQQSLSTFSSHMVNIDSIVKNATEDSLVLLDEICSGTDPQEGSALAMAILVTLRDKKSITLSTSHYSDVKEFALSEEGFLSASVSFDLKNLSPTYNLQMGIPGNSNAISISKRIGVSQDIINKSLSYMKESQKKLHNAIARMQKTKAENEQLLIQAKQKFKEAQELEKKYNDKINDLENKKENILSKAKESARKLYEESSSEVKEILKELRQMKVEGIDHKKAESLGKDINSKISKYSLNRENKSKSNNSPQKVKKGDQVYVINYQDKASVLEDSDKNGNFMAQMGIIKLKLNVNQVEKISQQQQDRHYQSMAKDLSIPNLSNKIDLRGENKEDTLVKLDKFIDQAYMARLPWIEIIHGKGTGVLRIFVHQMLSKNKMVKKYRLGNYNEGGDGVTIAYFE